MKLDGEHSIVVLELRDNQLYEAKLMKSTSEDALYTSDPFPSEEQAATEALIYYLTHIKGKQETRD